MRKTVNFLILVITILIMNLLTGYITEYFMHYKRITNPFKFTAIGMLVLIAVFYPLFGFMDGKVKDITKRLVNKGRNVFGKTFGILFVFSLLLFFIYCIYARLWFSINVPVMIWNKF